MVKTKTVKPEELIAKLAEDLLQDLQVVAEVKVSEEDGAYQVKILPREEDDVPLLIGYHGETVSSIQIILGLLVFKQVGEWVKLVVDVADYRDKRAAQLKAMADSFAAQALSTGQTIYLPPLSPAERRVIHLSLEGREDVESFSEGEGQNRRLAIKPKVANP